jgi:hypothetical protein
MAFRPFHSVSFLSIPFDSISFHSTQVKLFHFMSFDSIHSLIDPFTHSFNLSPFIQSTVCICLFMHVWTPHHIFEYGLIRHIQLSYLHLSSTFRTALYRFLWWSSSSWTNGLRKRWREKIYITYTSHTHTHCVSLHDMILHYTHTYIYILHILDILYTYMIVYDRMWNVYCGGKFQLVSALVTSIEHH